MFTKVLYIHLFRNDLFSGLKFISRFITSSMNAVHLKFVELLLITALKTRVIQENFYNYYCRHEHTKNLSVVDKNIRKI